MITSPIDPYPFTGMLDLFGIKKSALHDRLAALGIKTFKVGRNSYVRWDELLRLIELDQYLKEDKTRKIADFLAEKGIETHPPDALEVSAGDIEIRPPDVSDLSGGSFADFVALVQTIATLFPSDPLANYKALAEAAREEWLLPTRKVRELIGVKPKGHFFRRGSWAFERSGKIGNEAAWRVQSFAQTNKPRES